MSNKRKILVRIAGVFLSLFLFYVSTVSFIYLIQYMSLSAPIYISVALAMALVLLLILNCVVLVIGGMFIFASDNELFPYTSSTKSPIIYPKKISTSTNPIEKYQSYIKGNLIAKMTLDFGRVFRGVYPFDVMSGYIAVGPMQSFIGLAISEGYLEVTEKGKKYGL